MPHEGLALRANAACKDVAVHSASAGRQSFAWPSDAAGQVTLTTAQFDGLVAGLPWQRLSASAKPITVI